VPHFVLSKCLQFCFARQIFGPSEDQPLDVDGTRHAFEELAAAINEEASRAGQGAKGLDEIAYGFLKVKNNDKVNVMYSDILKYAFEFALQRFCNFVIAI
jgi:N-methylhydantoinase A/oxoprolinase/acetone carboxylase beta subunit